MRQYQGELSQATAEDAISLRHQLESTLGELERAKQTLRLNQPRYAKVFEPEPLSLADA